MFSRKTYYNFSRFCFIFLSLFFVKRLINIRKFRKKMWWTAQQILKKQHVILHNSPSLKYSRNYGMIRTQILCTSLVSNSYVQLESAIIIERLMKLAKKKNVPSFSCSNWANIKTQGSWKKNTSFNLCITWRSNKDREKHDDCFFVRIYLVYFFIDE